MQENISQNGGKGSRGRLTRQRRANMFQFKRDFEAVYTGARSIEQSRSLNPELQSFATWLSKNAGRIPIQ